MKRVFKGIMFFSVSIRLGILKAWANIVGDQVLNDYIERCSERKIKFALNKIGADVNNSANVKKGLILDNTYFNYGNLSIGENVFLGRRVFLDLANRITIKKDAVVSEGVSIMTHQDVGDRMLKSYYKRKDGEVLLDEGCFIGANATLLCSVRVGRCSVVAAGAVVTADVPDYTVVGGVPAKYIKTLN